MQKHAFDTFLKVFIKKVENKTLQVHRAFWLLATTGSLDSALLQEQLDIELKTLFSSRKTYEKLLKWQADPSLQEPLLKRQLELLIRYFKPNLIPKKWLAEISKKEVHLAYLFANFRPTLEGQPLSENEIRSILKNEKNIQRREEVWKASKEIGKLVAEDLLSLVKLRNQAAQSVGYSDYFEMQLDLQEIDRKWLFLTFDTLFEETKLSYDQLLLTIEEQLKHRFQVKDLPIGPWGWTEPFGQEDPLSFCEFDAILQGCDLVAFCKDFYRRLGFDLTAIIASSDLFEKEGKNPYAFCIHMDRKGDIRTLNNVKSTLKWLETLLHEFGHAIYERGLDEKLPWLLKAPPHMLATEAMALLGGRWAYRPQTLLELNPQVDPKLLKDVGESLRRRQLIFSRWVLVMTYFERELYREPDQDLQALWWHLVKKYQGIEMPQDRLQSCYADWACKSHLSLSPVYYFSYLLGEMLASEIEDGWNGKESLDEPEGNFLKEKLFFHGNAMRWDQLVEKLIGYPLHAQSWIEQFASPPSAAILKIKPSQTYEGT